MREPCDDHEITVADLEQALARQGGTRLDPTWTPRSTKALKSLAESGKIPARGTTPGRVLENSLIRGLKEEFEVGGPLRTTRNVRLGRA